MEAQATGADFEIVFVPYYHPTTPSKDTQEGHDEYYEHMPWCTLPFGDNHAQVLAQNFDIKKIPTLVVMNENGEVVSKAGKDDVEVGLNPLGSVKVCLEAWNLGCSPKLPEKPVFSFDMDDDF